MKGYALTGEEINDENNELREEVDVVKQRLAMMTTTKEELEARVRQLSRANRQLNEYNNELKEDYGKVKKDLLYEIQKGRQEKKRTDIVIEKLEGEVRELKQDNLGLKDEMVARIQALCQGAGSTSDHHVDVQGLYY